MRIIAGAWRGRPILTPSDRATRPTSDRAREGLFSMLVSRIGSFDGLTVADLFAGTGALGLEALSRGAAHCLFVDRDRAVADLIRRNLRAFGAEPRADVRVQSAEHVPPPPRPLHLVFLDPPYDGDLAAQTLPRLAPWLAPGGWVSVETGRPLVAGTPGLTREAERRFGKAHLTLFRRAG